jgi:23S rRNA (adenine2503-C2)-methyltransferase
LSCINRIVTIHFKDHTAAQIHAALAHVGVTPRLARQLQAAAVRRGAWPENGPGIPAKVLAGVRSLATIPSLTLVGKASSPRDGFTKYLFRGAGPEVFEAVAIPLLHRADDPKLVVCVSSQAGCALGCVFCATGRLGFQRDLAAWEMVDQVVRIQADAAHPVRGVVFMGMGEPLLNYDAVIRAAQVMAEPCGLAISGKAITISTAGIVPAIRRFTAERHPYRLVVSLTFADAERRRDWMPVERTNPTPDLIAALRDYHRATGQRVSLAWTLIRGVNTHEEDARRLADLTRGLPVKLDLIDVNDATGRYLPPSRAELDAFRDALRAHLGMPVARRYSGGRDIHAACGMLAGAQA